MKKRTVATITLTAITLTAGIYTYTNLPSLHSSNHHAYKYTQNTPLVAPEYVDYKSVIDALSTESQIVGLTGKSEKTVTHTNKKWYGDRAYTMTISGELKVGVDTQDIEIITYRNTIKVKFPQPKLISADFPFNNATIGKDVGLLRKDLSETELQSLYGKARKGAIDEFMSNEVVKEKAVVGVENAIDGLLKSVPNVEETIYETGE